ncbi:MAG: HlyD family efflux transporter periplasmic adaptor subunit [Pseudomonadota bacterium]
MSTGLKGGDRNISGSRAAPAKDGCARVDHAAPEVLVPAPAWHRLAALTLKTVLPIVFLAGGVWGWQMINHTAPVPGRQAVAPPVPMVETRLATPATEGPRITALGRVRAANSMVLSAPAAGRIATVAEGMVRHGMVVAGETIVTLDPGGLAHDLAAAEARVRQVEARITLEAGQGARASRDFQRLSVDVTDDQRALILREPQMAELVGERDAAVAEVARVRALIDDKWLKAPFDAVVTSAAAIPGARVEAGARLATLVESTAFDIALTVPLPDLAWIAIGDRVRLSRPGIWPTGTTREAEVIRIGAALSAGGALVEVIARLDDPLVLQPATLGPPVRLGAYLSAAIQRPVIDNTVEIARTELRGEGAVWVMDAADRLEERPVEILWADNTRVLIAAGLEPGERVITTPLGLYSPGMALRTEDNAATAGLQE